MQAQIRTLLAEQQISQVGFLPFADTILLHPRLAPDGAQSVILLLAPYDTGEPYSDGVSAYAHVLDYHRFYVELYECVLPALQKRFPEQHFWGFADHSPINEKDAAAKAGLGVIGCHSLLINPIYGSYVFIGSLLTDLHIPCQAQEIQFCRRCGACIHACPGQAVTPTGILPAACMSALSQKKRLTKEELALLRKHHIAWGCDRCQEVCPYNRERRPTEIPFFLQHRHKAFTAAEVAAMDDETFARQSFSWRGKDRILENLLNLESDKENSNICT